MAGLPTDYNKWEKINASIEPDEEDLARDAARRIDDAVVDLHGETRGEQLAQDAREDEILAEARPEAPLDGARLAGRAADCSSGSGVRCARVRRRCKRLRPIGCVLALRCRCYSVREHLCLSVDRAALRVLGRCTRTC